MPRLFTLLRTHKPHPYRALRLNFTRTLSSAMATAWTPNTYPPARRSDHTDVYKSESKGEVRVHDPYEWLEHNTEETDRWLTAQEAFTRQHLDKNTDRQNLENEIRKNTDYAKVSQAKYLGMKSLLNMSPVFAAESERRRTLVLVL